MIAGVLARATRASTTPLLPDDYPAVVNPLRSIRTPRGRIVATRPVGPATTELTIRTGAGRSGHRPGQHVGPGVELGGRRHRRTSSITSAPTDEHLTVSVTAVPDGSVSTHLARIARPGDLVGPGPAAGGFTADGEDAGALLPSGCRTGICHTCVGRLSAGAVRNLHTGELESADRGDVIVRTCVSAAAGDCAVDL